MPPVATFERGVETASPVYVDDAPAGAVVGPQVMEIGEQIVAQNNSLPLESVSIVVGSIDSAITRLILQRHMPGVDPAEIDRKIGLLESAKGHMTEALAGLMAAREGYATYLGDTAMTDVGENFKF